MYPVRMNRDYITAQLLGEEKRRAWDIGQTDSYRQMSMFDDGFLNPAPTAEDRSTVILGQM